VPIAEDGFASPSHPGQVSRFIALRINSNFESASAQRNRARTPVSLGKASEQLSSGLRINKAGNDAAGFAVSEKLKI
jgi:hypothetical protein